ncbi:hypothetical protein KOM00_03295 [Geomonas sp. Red69]|uniref:Uncharacterized protein n=1 Tax=Geomonas diazotrophica TaxID=2843197 RepID=A0ABX8JLJ0_9BACT|nr:MULTISPECIES: hypothetical protein [Geomonas]MBU5635753.1 hypothetical protein [Geomonas diazotrophica]QWV98011.1 hypothetical protein KP005_01585 [Geomonas nitrogeniifigens]QXE87142.1 hypothetical protein KP003_01685 [Geomonas nitrogeniifigens]
MRKMALMLAAGLFMLSSVPAYAQMAADQKDECLLASKNCMNQVDDIQQRIRKLNREIEKGTRVYTPQELKKLQDKLKEADDILRNLERPDS